MTSVIIVAVGRESRAVRTEIRSRVTAAPAVSAAGNAHGRAVCTSDGRRAVSVTIAGRSVIETHGDEEPESRAVRSVRKEIAKRRPVREDRVASAAVAPVPPIRVASATVPRISARITPSIEHLNNLLCIEFSRIFDPYIALYAKERRKVHRSIRKRPAFFYARRIQFQIIETRPLLSRAKPAASATTARKSAESASARSADA